MSADLSRVTTNGFSAINPGQFPAANPDADGYRNTSGNFAITHHLSINHSFGACIFKSNGDVSYDSAFGTSADEQSSTTRLSQFNIFTDNTFGNWRSRLKLSEQSEKSRPRDCAAFGFNGSFVTRATVLGWVNTIALTDNWVATAGLEQQRQRVELSDDDPQFGNSNSYNQRRNTTAVFAGVEGRLGGGNVQLNVRRDKVGDLDATTGFMGYGYPIGQSFKLIASLSTAFNAPPLGYLFAPGYGNPLLRDAEITNIPFLMALAGALRRCLSLVWLATRRSNRLALHPASTTKNGTVINSASLRLEHAKSREFGVQYERDGQLLRATYFDTRIRDPLSDDQIIGTFNNIDRTRNRGTELSYKGSVGLTDIRAGLTLQDPVNELTGERLQRRAASLLTAGISHPIGAFRFGADLLYSGERPDAYFDPASFSSVKTTLASYTRLNLAAQYKVSSEVLLRARLDNATDAKYQTVYGYNQPQRSLYFGLV